LAETHDSTDITTASEEWKHSTVRTNLPSKRTWISQYIHLENHHVITSIADMDGIFDPDGTDENPDDGYSISDTETERWDI